ncbi:flavin reductase family protein [Streptomyces sp. L500]
MNPAAIETTTGRIPVEPASMRATMGRFATGVIVLGVGGEHPHAMTANAFSSVSLDPPKVLCCVAHSAVMHRSLTDARRFGVSILGAAQEPVARHFADKNRPLGPEQFDGLDWEPGPLTGAPLLRGAAAWLECELSESHDSGDHTVFIGDVLRAVTAPGTPGLLFFDGRFGRTGATAS